MEYPMGYIAMLKALEKKGLLPPFKNNAHGLRIVDKARQLDKKRSKELMSRPARITETPKTKDSHGSSPEKPLPPTKTLLDLLRAFKRLYAGVSIIHKKDKIFKAKNPNKTYRPESRDLLILRAMSKRYSPIAVGTAIEPFIEYCIQKDRSITVKAFENWAKTKWKRASK